MRFSQASFPSYMWLFASTLHYSIMFLMLLWVYFLLLLMANDFEFQKFSQKYVIIIRIYSRISLYVHYDNYISVYIYVHAYFNIYSTLLLAYRRCCVLHKTLFTFQLELGSAAISLQYMQFLVPNCFSCRDILPADLYIVLYTKI